MMMSSEPILDVLRGISTVASFSIVFNSINSAWKDLTTGSCEHCMGAGIVICPRCNGSKSLRSRPAAFSYSESNFVDDGSNHHPCIACGPNAECDFEEHVSDDEDRAWVLRDDLVLAMNNKPRKTQVSVLAGTVKCPDCFGSPVFRLSPNLERFLGLEEPWHHKVASRLTMKYIGAENRPAHRQRALIEYPGAPLPKPESIADATVRYYIEKQLDDAATAEEKESSSSGPKPDGMSGADQLTNEDFIFTYIDDSDSELDTP